MSQWGANDHVVGLDGAITVTLDGVALTRASGSIDFTTTDLIKPGDVIEIGGVGGVAVVNAVNSATKLNLVSNTNLSAETATAVPIKRLSHMPIDAVQTYSTAANTVMGVDVTEQGVDVTAQQSAENDREIANTAAHAGWVKVGDLYTDSNSNVRRKNETLVAMSSIVGDSNLHDDEHPDS